MTGRHAAAAGAASIDTAALWRSIEDYGAIGGTPAGGVTRLTLTEEDRAARLKLQGDLASVGAVAAVDDLGNIYGRVEGADPAALPVVFGSHLDTVPRGGRFDGALGVLGGLAVLRSLHAAGIKTRRPLVLVDWTNEEGARFEPCMLASGVVAGVFDRAWAGDRTDRDGRRFDDELQRIGFTGDAADRLTDAHAYLELHIEQGPALEASGDEVGIVEGIMGIRWYDLVLTGDADHAGPTPLPLRRDALLAAARIVTGVRALAERVGGGAVGTVGRLDVEPNAINVIPGRVTMSVDLRHPTAAGLDALDAGLRDLVAEAAGEEIQGTLTRQLDSAPTPFTPAILDAADRAAAARGLRHRRIVSAAGHDAKYMADRFPTAMLFVPCRAGKSHNEAEYASPEACAAGATLLLDLVLHLAERV